LVAFEILSLSSNRSKKELNHIADLSDKYTSHILPHILQTRLKPALFLKKCEAGKKMEVDEKMCYYILQALKKKFLC